MIALQLNWIITKSSFYKESDSWTQLILWVKAAKQWRIYYLCSCTFISTLVTNLIIFSSDLSAGSLFTIFSSAGQAESKWISRPQHWLHSNRLYFVENRSGNNFKHFANTGFEHFWSHSGPTLNDLHLTCLSCVNGVCPVHGKRDKWHRLAALSNDGYSVSLLSSSMEWIMTTLLRGLSVL